MSGIAVTYSRIYSALTTGKNPCQQALHIACHDAFLMAENSLNLVFIKGYFLLACIVRYLGCNNGCRPCQLPSAQGWQTKMVILEHLQMHTKQMHTKKVLAGLILASSGFFAVGASAAVIPAFDWTTDGGFIIGGSTCSNGGEAACNITYDNATGVTPSGIAGTASIMTWGTGSTAGAGTGTQSGLQGVFGASGAGGYNAQALGSDPVLIPMFQQIITNGGWTNTGAAVHYNNIITPAGGFMTSSTLSTTFQLLTPADGPINLANIDIGFLETPNISPCATTNPHNTVCDDIFTISALPPPIVFVLDGTSYTVTFRFADGPGSIVVDDTIWTAEDSPGTAVMYTQARIDAKDVPVPGVLALMGMGLMMLGWKKRDRKVA